jgi:diguanylate cyclase (GGDEF)-like protein/PAS domain S-box-containing protein
MTRGIFNPRLGIFLNAGIGIVFIAAAAIVIITVNYNMRQQALVEARSKARIILDRNLATHTYFSQIMKPAIFAWSKPFRTKDYFDHTWMSSTYAIREIEKYFKSFNPSGYSFKDAAVNARSPENEADKYELAFIEKMNKDKEFESESVVRKIDNKPYLIVLRKGEVMEASCLRCHSKPEDAPKGLTDYYGSERSFNRKAGDLVSAVSLRIPLSEAYAAANVFSFKLSAILLIVLTCLFAIQYWLYRRFLLEPLNIMREKANQIAAHEEHLGEEIPRPFGIELSELTDTFNKMSIKLRHDRDNLEELVNKRTEALKESEEQFHSLFENMLDGFAYCRMLYDEENRPVDFVYLEVNKAFDRLTGLTDVVGKQVSEVIPGIKELNPELFEIYGRVALTGNPEMFEIDFKPLAKQLSVSVYSIRKEYFAAIFEDITERKRFEKQLLTMSMSDELTGLYNRRGFFTFTRQQLKAAERAKKDVLLFFTDLDNMKQINDTLGHQEGDKALVEIATVLKKTFRESDIIGRIGGDEFAVLAIDVIDKTGEVLIKRLQNALGDYNRLEDRNYMLSLSTGIAHYDPENPSSLDELMTQADTLMYKEKRKKQQ